MLTFSEIVVTAVIWILALAGSFFTIKAVRRRRRDRRNGSEERRESAPPS